MIEHVTRIAGGVTQQNHMQFGLMVQNEDSAAQALSQYALCYNNEQSGVDP